MAAAPLTLGLIGAGRIGRIHAENLTRHVPRARLLMVADVVEQAARACAGAFAIPRTETDYRALLDSPEIDAVVIASATDTHARLITEAAQAGKHIFCEKPIAFTLPEIDQALAAVARAGVKLQIGFNRRFDASYQRVRAAIERGEIGQPWRLHIISRDPAPPPLEYVRTSGGLFLDMSIHDFDMARFLIGSEVEEVFARADVLVDPAIGAAGDVDTAITVLTFANRVIGTVDNCRQAVFGYDQRVEVLGSAGLISTENRFPNTAVVSTRQGVCRDLPLHFFTERYAESYRAELAAFVDAVLDDRPVPVNGQDGRAPVVMALAARRSLEERRPVRLAEVDPPRAAHRT